MTNLGDRQISITQVEIAVIKALNILTEDEILAASPDSEILIKNNPDDLVRT